MQTFRNKQRSPQKDLPDVSGIFGFCVSILHCPTFCSATKLSDHETNFSAEHHCSPPDMINAYRTWKSKLETMLQWFRGPRTVVSQTSFSASMETDKKASRQGQVCEYARSVVSARRAQKSCGYKKDCNVTAPGSIVQLPSKFGGMFRSHGHVCCGAPRSRRDMPQTGHISPSPLRTQDRPHSKISLQQHFISCPWLIITELHTIHKRTKPAMSITGERPLWSLAIHHKFLSSPAHLVQLSDSPIRLIIYGGSGPFNKEILRSQKMGTRKDPFMQRNYSACGKKGPFVRPPKAQYTAAISHYMTLQMYIALLNRCEYNPCITPDNLGLVPSSREHPQIQVLSKPPGHKTGLKFSVTSKQLKISFTLCCKIYAIRIEGIIFPSRLRQTYTGCCWQPKANLKLPTGTISSALSPPL